MQHFMDRRRTQMTQVGRVIYRIKPDFANDIGKMAVFGLTPKKQV